MTRRERCRHENADHLKAGDHWYRWGRSVPGYSVPGYLALVEQLRCLDCGAWLPLGPARHDGPHAEQVWIERPAARWAVEFDRPSKAGECPIPGDVCSLCEARHLTDVIRDHDRCIATHDDGGGE